MGPGGRGDLPSYLAAVTTREGGLADPSEASRCVQTADGWKRNQSVGGQHELYDLACDPHELHNLAGRASCRPRMREMAELIARWQEGTGHRLGLLPV